MTLIEFPTVLLYKTLYKTQIRELKDECDEKSKLCKDMQRRLAVYEDER